MKLLQKSIKTQGKLQLSHTQLSQPKLLKKHIQQLPKNVPSTASLKTKTEEPASTFIALANITISIPEQRWSNPKHNGKKNFLFR